MAQGGNREVNAKAGIWFGGWRLAVIADLANSLPGA
jgi:hypothetical protein